MRVAARFVMIAAKAVLSAGFVRCASNPARAAFSLSSPWPNPVNATRRTPVAQRTTNPSTGLVPVHPAHPDVEKDQPHSIASQVRSAVSLTNSTSSGVQPRGNISFTTSVPINACGAPRSARGQIAVSSRALLARRFNRPPSTHVLQRTPARRISKNG
jgi:hypothetical protein